MRSRHEPVVSVIVPTYNPGGFLEPTLASVRAQTIDALQLIVVDDGSTDGTPDWVRRTQTDIELYEQRNQGVSAARNHGLRRARAPFVIFLDQDDVWHPAMLERQLACLRSHSNMAAVAAPHEFWFAEPDGSYATPRWPDDPGEGVLASGFEGWTYHQFLYDNWALTSGTLLRTSVVREMGGFDEELPLSEDWDLWLRISARYPFAQLAWPAVMYRQHDAQGSRVARPVDHRTLLLQRYSQRHGLCSPDGQCLPRSEFRARLAHYRMEFGYHHLCFGQKGLALRALLQAWSWQPWRLRWLSLALAGACGWKPSAE